MIDPTIPEGLGVGWIAVLIAGIVLFAYLDIITTRSDDSVSISLKFGLWGLVIPLVVAIAGTLLYESLRVLGT